MRVPPILTTAAAVALVVLSPGLRAQRSDAVVVAVDTPMAAPAWALAERALLKVNGEGVAAYAGKFLDARGFLPVKENWGVSDGPDDLTENIRNWPLAHALGGPDAILDHWQKLWEGHLQQFTRAKIPQLPMARDGIYYKEFITSFDWEHTSEGLGPFYFYGLSRPSDPKHQERARRFAGFYMNEDPGAPNFDPKHMIVRSLFNGSRGPQLTPATPDEWDGPAAPGTDPNSSRRTRFLTSSNIRGDHPLNLNVASLVFNAYLLTGDDKYRDWAIKYVDAWRGRIDESGGNIPSNIGLDGRVGGEWDGRWYRGVFGWSSPDEGERNYVFRGPPEAFGAALLLTGDQKYAQVMRRQMDNLFAAKRVEDGKTLLPRYHGDKGWYGHHPISGGPSGALGNIPNILVDLFLWSFLPADLERLPPAAEPRARHHPDLRWIAYLQNGDANYPLTALQEGLDEVRRMSQRMQGLAPAGGGRGGRGNAPAAGAAASAPGQGRGAAGEARAPGGGPALTANPVSTTALINLTMGASDPGGSTHGPTPLYAQVRHFDPDGKRAGLPEDVAALVQRIDKDSVTLTLVNTSPIHARNVAVQMGAYAEHHAVSVKAGDRVIPIDAPWFTVRLAAGAGETLTIQLRRYAHRPTLAFPWDRARTVEQAAAPAAGR